MKDYTTKNIRNVAIMGHQGSGKTSLSESLLFVSKAIEKKGEVERKNTVSDYLVEEQTKQGSFSTSLIPVEWNDYKINFLDTPGSEEFLGDIHQVLGVVKGTVLLVDAAKGVEVGTERYWNEIRKRHLPAVLFVNKMDKENVDFDKTLADIRAKLGPKAVPFCYPIGKEDSFDGFIDIVDLKAYTYDGTKMVVGDVFADKLAKVKGLRDALVEAVAETSEELLEKFFGGEDLTSEEIKKGLKIGVMNGDVTPVLVGCATKNVGVETLLSMLLDYLPAPDELGALKGVDLKGNAVSRKTEDSEPFSAYVFKTIFDPFLGAINLLKINSGTLATGQEVVTNKDENKKIGAIFSLRGKTQLPLSIAYAGDIVATAKIDLSTTNSISDVKNPVCYPAIPIVTPVIYIAVHPKNKNDEDKISSALQKINLEDPSFSIVRNKETAQLLLGGQGMTHLGYILEKLKTMFKVDVDIDEQKIVYRETIKRKVEAQGKHKKQSGGAGQYGDVHIRFEPSEKIFEFASEVVGGVVPRGYFPAVEKGLIETFEKGPLAGFPVINVKAVLFYGSYHDVDSNEISFKLAAALAFKNAVPNAGCTILEPIVKMEITIKDNFVGDVMGDMNKRRGRVLGTEQADEGYQRIIAEAPEAEIVKYAIDLKAMTQGSGSFTREFDRFEEVRGDLVDKIVEQYKKA